MSWFKSKPEVPEAYREYAESIRGLKRSTTPIRNQKFLVVDTETTGLNVNTDSIVSIGIVPIRGYVIHSEDTREWIIQSDQPSGGGASIHGVMPHDQRSGIPAKEAAEEFLMAADGAIVVGHHIGFDAAMLDVFLRHQLRVPFLNPTYDTGHMFRRLKGSPYRLFDMEPAAEALDMICEDLGIPIDDRHTALGDAAATAILFMRLLKDLEKRGVNTTAKLLAR
ncbi:MAG: 3'-5' exonuclease [Bacteroidetes bacterium]|nr:MAG: 3'-5' exonuclease [Bacteroidota bacterium]